MDACSQQTLPAPPAPKRRSQKYRHFRLQPEDAALLELLPARQRELLKSEGSYQETAKRLGIPVGTVRSGLHRARAEIARLRQIRPDANIP